MTRHEHTVLRVGVAGLGWMGGLHSRCYRRFPEHFPETGVAFTLQTAATRSRELGRDAVERLGFADTTSRPLDLAVREDIDIVSICSPNAEHAELAVAAAEAGKALWIEKPVGRSVAEVRRVSDAVRMSGVTVGVGHNYRLAPAVRVIRRDVRAGALGSIEHVRGKYDAGFASDPASPLTWRFDRDQAGGGASSDILSHLVDLAQFVAGPISEITGRMRTVHRHRPVPREAGGHFGSNGGSEIGEVTNDDLAVTLCVFANGALGTLNANRTSRSAENGLEIEIHGSEGYAAWNSERPHEYLWRDLQMDAVAKKYVDAASPGYGRFLPGPGLGLGFDDVKLLELGELVSQLQGTATDSATINDALRFAQLEEALHAAHETNSWVSIDRPPQ